MYFRLVLEQVVDAEGILVRKVIDGARERAEEFLVAAFERPEMRREAEMPLAGERGRVAGIAQQRRQGRMRRRQAEMRVAARRAAADRLVRAAAQAVLPAAGHEREARR